MKTLLLFIVTVSSIFAESPFRTEIEITSPFLATTGYGGERRNNLHIGMDCFAKNYYPVITPIASGEVQEIGIDRVYGKYVIVLSKDERGEFYHLYAHGKLIYNSASGAVDTNTKLMIMGSTGYSDNPHLHLEVYRIIDGIKIYEDPENYI